MLRLVGLLILLIIIHDRREGISEAVIVAVRHPLESLPPPLRVTAAGSSLLALRPSCILSRTYMFKLRPNLAAPFGLLGDEAKLSFRSQAGGIAKLASTRVSL